MVAEGRGRGRAGRGVPGAAGRPGHGPAPRRHRDAAGPGPGQDGGGRHRHRPGRAHQDQRRAEDLGGRAAGQGAGAGRARVQRQLDPAAAHRALRRARPEAGQEDQDRLLDRRPDAREPARRPSDHRRAALLSRGGEAALDLRREPAGRGGRGRPDPRLVPPDGGPDRAHLLGPAEPAQHPGAHRAGQAVPPGLRARRGLLVPGGRLRPGGAAGDRPPLRGCGADRGHDVGVRRAPGGGVGRLPGAGRGGHPHPARVLQDGLLRPGLRHGGLRAEPAPGRRRWRRRPPSWTATSAPSRG